MDWDWDHLRFFLALARGLTLGRAAERLDVSHTTVLRRIRQLEQQLDTRLFDRTPDGWRLTQVGERLLGEVEQMEHALAALSNEIVGADHRLQGPVVLATSEAFAVRVLPDALAALKQRHPGLELTLKIGRDIVDLARREADIALRITPSPPESLVGRRIGQVWLALVASRAYAARHGLSRLPDRPDGHQFVVTPHGSSPLAQWLGPTPPPSSVTTVDCKLAAVALARAGLGITEVPSYLANDDDLVVLDAPWEPPGVPVWLLSHPEARASARVRVACALLVDELVPRLGVAGPIAA